MSADEYRQRRAHSQKEWRKAMKDIETEIMEDEIHDIIEKALPLTSHSESGHIDMIDESEHHEYDRPICSPPEDSTNNVQQFHSNNENMETDECLLNESCGTIPGRGSPPDCHQEHDSSIDSYEDIQEDERDANVIYQYQKEEIDWSEDDTSSVDSKLANAIAIWSIEFKVKRNALSALLKILNEHGHPSICKTSKTLLHTPRSTVNLIKDVGNGKFWYYGIVKSMKKRLPTYVKNIQEKKITIDVFVDGLRVYKSVQKEAWPLLGCLKDQSTPFVIGMWCGESKDPENVDGFWEDFIKEGEYLLKHGLTYENQTYEFEIRNYLGDAPARAWFKKTCPHNSTICCERCTISAHWLQHRMTYDPEEISELRSDESFRNQTQQEYHKGSSPLLKLGANLISQVPLDPMHMCDLGAMKRWFGRLITKKKGRYKLQNGILVEISNLMSSLVEYLPSEFCRTKRSLSDWGLLTSKEYRRMSLYDGFLLFNRTPHPELFRNFCLLGCSLRILTDRKLVHEFACDADILLKEFVKDSARLFGKTFVVYNIHHLTHLADECKRHGSLDEFSCYKYESYLHEIKLNLFAPGRTLPQLICRTMEAAATLPDQEPVTFESLLFEQPHECGPTLDHCRGQQFKKLIVEKCMFRIMSTNDCFCLTKKGEVVWIKNVVKGLDEFAFIIGQKFNVVKDYFNYPLPSSLLEIFAVHNLERFHRAWAVNEIKKKVVLFPLDMLSLKKDWSWNDTSGLCLPVLHTSTEKPVQNIMEREE